MRGPGDKNWLVNVQTANKAFQTHKSSLLEGGNKLANAEHTSYLQRSLWFTQPLPIHFSPRFSGQLCKKNCTARGATLGR